jgi:hypothetical protein
MTFNRTAPSGPTWDVVATIAEPRPLVLAFVAHHIQQGARRLHLYFDRVDAETLAMVRALPQVRAVDCNAAFWARHGRRPPAQIRRQLANAAKAFAQASSDWLLHCDADEYLSDGKALRSALSGVSPAVQVVKLHGWERCFLDDSPLVSVFDGAFRGAAPAKAEPLLQRAYGDIAQFLHNGLVAYSGTKALTRVGAPLNVGIHDSFARDGNGRSIRKAVVARQIARDVKILHYDGLTPRSTTQKMIAKVQDLRLRKGRGLRPHRLAQLAAIDDGLATEVGFWRLRRVPDAAQATLRDLGVLTEIPFDPRPAVRSIWPGLTLDYTPDAFDRWLQVA